MTTKRTVLYLALAGVLAAGFAAPAAAQDTIKIGELNSYKAFPAFLDPYKKGMAIGGRGDQRQGRRPRQEAGSDLARRRRQSGRGGARRRRTGHAREASPCWPAPSCPISAWPSPTSPARRRSCSSPPSRSPTRSPGQNGNKYTFRLRASTYMQTAMLMPDAVAAHKKRWALVYPNFEYGQSAAANFKALMKKAQPDVEFVTEQATPLGQDRRRRGGAGDRRRQARRHLQRAVRRRPRQVRARGQHPRRVQEPHGGQPAVGRAGISRSAQGRGAGRLDRHRLSLEQDQDARSTSPSSMPIRRSTKPIRGSARWSAT